MDSVKCEVASEWATTLPELHFVSSFLWTVKWACVMATLNLFLNALLSPPYFYLAVGVALFAATVASLVTGKTIARYNGWVDRAKNPGSFWFGVVAYLFPRGLFHLAVLVVSMLRAIGLGSCTPVVGESPAILKILVDEPAARLRRSHFAPAIPTYGNSGIAMESTLTSAKPQHRMRHVRLFQRFHFLGCQFHRERGDRIVQMMRFARADDR